MNRTLKIGLFLLGAGVFLNILARIVGPSILRIPVGAPHEFPLTLMLALATFGSPLLALAGIVVCAVGSAKRKS